MTERIGDAVTIGVSKFTRPSLPNGSGCMVSGSRIMTRLYAGTWKRWFLQSQ